MIGRFMIGLMATAAVSATATAAEYRVERLTPSSPFHGIHGLRFDQAGQLFGISVMGQALYRIDPASRRVDTVVGPPMGSGDDLAIGPDGSLYWTSIFDGAVHVKRPGSPAAVLTKILSPNAISFSPDGKRLFVSQIFGADGLWEVDPAGQAPNRKIAENIGGFNAFEVGGDGMLYGPLQFQKRYVRIDPETGAITTIADGFQRPVSSKLDFKGGAYVADLGQIYYIDLKTGAKRPLAKVPVPQDNIALDKSGRHLLVSLPSWNAIWSVDVETGAMTEVIGRAALTAPAGLTAAHDGGEARLYVADLWGVRTVDPVKPQPADLTIQVGPSRISAAGPHLVAVSETTSEVSVLDRATGAKISTFSGFVPLSLGDALELPDGALLITDRRKGELLRTTGSGPLDRAVVASGLKGPNGLTLSGGAVFVSETEAGIVSRIDLSNGQRSVVLSGLDRPEGLAMTAAGRLVIVEVGAKRVVGLDTKTGARETLARRLPIGERYGPNTFRGVAVVGDGIYLTSDIDNSIYRLTPP
jgi:sugar lactone lactonase YvrE